MKTGFRKYTVMPVLQMVVCFLLAAQLSAQVTRPIISNEPNPVLPFYDRLDLQQRASKGQVEADSSFDWLVGSWAVSSRGYAKNGFKGKKELSWQEPQREIIRDNDRNFYLTFRDSIIKVITQEGIITAPFIPALFLHFDKSASVWVFKGGYEWGSEISPGWRNKKAVFRGTISLAGLKINERQTWTKISNNEFHILYEEQLKDNSWFVTERNIYKRQIK